MKKTVVNEKPAVSHSPVGIEKVTITLTPVTRSTGVSEPQSRFDL